MNSCAVFYACIEAKIPLGKDLHAFASVSVSVLVSISVSVWASMFVSMSVCVCVSVFLCLCLCLCVCICVFGYACGYLMHTCVRCICGSTHLCRDLASSIGTLVQCSKRPWQGKRVAVCCSVLQCVAVCCSVLL